MAATPVPIEGANTIVGFSVAMPFTTTDVYTFSFPYISQDDFQIFVNSETLLESDDFVFTSEFLIQLTDIGRDKLNVLYGTLLTPVTVLIRRRTELTVRLVDFQDGATLTEAELDLSSRQSFFLVQEVYDSSELGNVSFDPIGGKIDMGDAELINVADPTALQSVVTLNALLDKTITPTYAENDAYRAGRMIFFEDDLYRANTDIVLAPAVFVSGDFDLILSSEQVAAIAVNTAKLALIGITQAINLDLITVTQAVNLDTIENDTYGVVTVHQDMVDSGSGSIITNIERVKLNSIESGAKDDQTGAEIKVAYEGELDTNAFTDAEKTKLGAVETSATADQTDSEIKISYENNVNTNEFTDAEKTKLANLDLSGEANQTDSEIKIQYENNANTNEFSDSEQTKLSGIEALAEVNQTDGEIKTQYEANTNTNGFTDAEKSKLASIDESKFLGEFVSLAALQLAHPSPIVGSYANVDLGVGQDVVRYLWDSNDTIYVEQGGVSTALSDAQIKTQYENNADTNVFLDSEKTKLTGIETSATADQTGAEIKAAYEAEGNTNAFTDTEKTKLSNIEVSATSDQTDSEIKIAYENNADTNAFTDAEKTAVSTNTAKISYTDSAAVSANTAKVTNATHTSEVTGDTALTLQAIAVSNKALKSTPTGTEEVLINDVGTLKKTTIQDIADLAAAGSAAEGFAASFSGVPTGASGTVTITADELGLNGNSITITGNSSAPLITQNVEDSFVSSLVNSNHLHQTFIVGASNVDVSKVTIKLHRTGTSGTVKVNIHEVSGVNDDIGTQLATSVTVAINTMTTNVSGADVDFIWSSPPTLTAGTKYTLVVDMSAISTSDIFTHKSTADVYADNKFYRLDGVWVEQTGDMYFILFSTDGDDIDALISAWNISNPTNTATVNVGGTEVIDDGIVVALTGGVAPISIDVLIDVDTTTVAPVIGDNLQWDGDNFVPTLSNQEVVSQLTGGKIIPIDQEYSAQKELELVGRTFGDVPSHLILPPNTNLVFDQEGGLSTGWNNTLGHYVVRADNVEIVIAGLLAGHGPDPVGGVYHVAVNQGEVSEVLIGPFVKDPARTVDIQHKFESGTLKAGDKISLITDTTASLYFAYIGITESANSTPDAFSTAIGGNGLSVTANDPIFFGSTSISDPVWTGTTYTVQSNAAFIIVEGQVEFSSAVNGRIFADINGAAYNMTLDVTSTIKTFKGILGGAGTPLVAGNTVFIYHNQTRTYSSSDNHFLSIREVTFAEVLEATTNLSIESAFIKAPELLEPRTDTQANLDYYVTLASTTNGQLCYATDTKKIYIVIDNVLRELPFI